MKKEFSGQLRAKYKALLKKITEVHTNLKINRKKIIEYLAEIKIHELFYIDYDSFEDFVYFQYFDESLGWSVSWIKDQVDLVIWLKKWDISKDVIEATTKSVLNEIRKAGIEGKKVIERYKGVTLKELREKWRAKDEEIDTMFNNIGQKEKKAPRIKGRQNKVFIRPSGQEDETLPRRNNTMILTYEFEIFRRKIDLFEKELKILCKKYDVKIIGDYE